MKGLEGRKKENFSFSPSDSDFLFAFLFSLVALLPLSFKTLKKRLKTLK